MHDVSGDFGPIPNPELPHLVDLQDVAIDVHRRVTGGLMSEIPGFIVGVYESDNSRFGDVSIRTVHSPTAYSEARIFERGGTWYISQEQQSPSLEADKRSLGAVRETTTYPLDPYESRTIRRMVGWLDNQGRLTGDEEVSLGDPITDQLCQNLAAQLRVLIEQPTTSPVTSRWRRALGWLGLAERHN